MKLSTLKLKTPKLAAITAFFLVSVYVVIGIVWSFLNIVHEPKYGDTAEYWHLSKTLNIDSWRTIGYPVLLKLLSLIPEDILLIRTTLYLIQITLSLAAFYYLFSSLFDIYYKHRLDRRLQQKISLITALILTISPVLMHMNLTVLSDSLANSFFIIFVAAFLKILVGKSLGKIDYILFISSIILMGVMRQDRLLIALVCIVAGLLSFVIRKRGSIALLATASIVVFLTIGLNMILQKPNPSRPRMSWQFTLFDRVAQGRLTRSMSYMPSVIQERTALISEKWDSSQSNWVGVAKVLDDSEGKQAMVSAVLVTIKKYPFEIIQDVASDFVEYLFSPLTYMFETVIGDRIGGSSFWTTWTNSRMGMYHNKLTRLYLSVHFIILTTATVIIVRLHFHNKRKIRKDMSIIVGGILIVTVITAVVHTLQSSLGFHIRYALPIYSLQLALIAFTLVVLCMPQHLEKR